MWLLIHAQFQLIFVNTQRVSFIHSFIHSSYKSILEGFTIFHSTDTAGDFQPVLSNHILALFEWMSPHGRPVIKQRSVWICAPYLCNLNTVTSPVLHHISAVGAEWSNVMWARRIYPLDPPVHMNWHTSIFSSVNHTMGIIRTENQSNGLYVVLIFYCYAVNLSN